MLATGYNTVDIEALAERSIPVCNVVAYGVDDVAQHVLALLLELCRHTSLHTRSVKDGEWEKAKQWCFWKRTPLCLQGLTMGVIGFGSIGRRVGELAHAFGMHVLAHCRTPKIRRPTPRLPLPGWSSCWLPRMSFPCTARSRPRLAG